MTEVKLKAHSGLVQDMLNECLLLEKNLKEDASNFSKLSIDQVQQSNQSKLDAIEKLQIMKDKLRDAIDEIQVDPAAKALLEKLKAVLVSCDTQINSNGKTVNMYIQQAKSILQKVAGHTVEIVAPLYDKQGKTQV